MQTLLLVLAIVPVVTALIPRVVNVAEEGFFGGGAVGKVGIDFAVFYTGGSLIVDGTPEVLYDTDEFPAAYEEASGTDHTPGILFANPPAFAFFFAPLTLLSIEAAWALWLALGVAALALALRNFGITKTALLVCVLLVSAPGWHVWRTGQGTFFWLLVVSAAYAALARRRIRLGGAFAGLLAFKPPLLLGLLLWWAIDKRMRPALAAASASAAITYLITVPFTRTAWLDYPNALFGFAAEHRSTRGQLSQYSPWGFVELLVPGNPVIGVIFGVVASVIGIAAYRRFYLKHRDDWRLLFAGAVIATLWISPHALGHDWMLLVAAMAVLWSARPDQRSDWISIAGFLSVLSLWSFLITAWSMEAVGWAFQLAVVGLPVAAWWIAKTLDRTEPSSTTAGVGSGLPLDKG